MTHMRYWAMTLGVAVSGAFIAIDRFAFAPSTAVWIAFAVAIAATISSVAATVMALPRQNHAFSGISALSALVGAWTVIATRVFPVSSAVWLTFAGGLALLLLSLRALALHETTVERVVHALELNGSGEGVLAIGPTTTQPVAVTAAWMQWLSNTALAIAGAFVVLATFAWQNPAQGVSVRWLAFGVGIAAAVAAFGALIERALAVRAEGPDAGQIVATTVTAVGAAIAIGLIVLMATLHGADARWWAFGLGDGLVGASLVAAAVHEFRSERVRHELEVARASSTSREPAVASR